MCMLVCYQFPVRGEQTLVMFPEEQCHNHTLPMYCGLNGCVFSSRFIRWSCITHAKQWDYQEVIIHKGHAIINMVMPINKVEEGGGNAARM